MSELAVVKPNPGLQRQSDATSLLNLQGMDLGQIFQVAEYFAQSDLVPKAYKGKPADVLVAWQFGAEVGLPPMRALSYVAVINGSPRVWGDAAVGLIQSHPEYDGMDEAWDAEAQSWTITLHRAGGKTGTGTFSAADAKQAKLINKDTYQGYLRDMLWWKAFHRAARRVFADVAVGLADISPREVETLRDVSGTAETEPARRPRSGTGERLRQAMGLPEEPPKNPDAVPPNAITLDDALADIAACESLDALNDADLLARLGTLKGADKRAAGKAYKARAAELVPSAPAMPDCPEAHRDLLADLRSIRDEHGADAARQALADADSLSDDDRALLADLLKSGA